ncbi:DUF4176 domain-containing protein [Streptococcus merionis]|uniref:DUF4176 domain-containing protein n=1 Tax=Streptococcus merionis TaxID=400065 RepID=UPI003519A747
MKLLPIGSIVYLMGGNQKVVILNRGAVVLQNEKEVLFDYTGAMYPEGLNPNQVYYFNHSDIDEIIFTGYSDKDEERFVSLFEKWLNNEGKSIERGKTDI